MMKLYREQGKALFPHEWAIGERIPPDVVWVDLHHPTKEEEAAAEKFLGQDLPTLEEMGEIEISNRLYMENNALFMTATVVKADATPPVANSITFVLCHKVLVTIRYVDIMPFQRFTENIEKLLPEAHEGATLLLGLLDLIVDRVADILELIGREIDSLHGHIFHRTNKKGQDSFERILTRIGDAGDLASKIHESLVSFNRLAVYAGHHKKMVLEANESRLAAVRRDIAGLNEHNAYLGNKLSFLLDATLGRISIDQNNVVKVLSVASLVFMPPTLIAGIYGMNFKIIPELNWHWGYPYSLVLMLLSGILPYAYLKQKKWL